MAEVINKTVPCERFVIRMWTGSAQLGYRLPLIRKSDGTFKRFSDLAMVEQAEMAPETVISASLYVAEHPGVYQGNSLKEIAERFPLFEKAIKSFGVQSAMIF